MKTNNSIKSDDLSESLRRKIFELQSDKPVRLVPERELAAQLGVSRMTVRVVLKKLKDEGILVQKQGSGTFINAVTGLDQISFLVAPDLKKDDPFYTAFMSEVYHALSKKNISVKFVDCDRIHTAGQDKSPLIIIGIIDEELIKRVVEAYINVITVYMYPDIDTFTQIVFDDYGIGYRAAKLLIERDMNVLVHLAGPLKYPSPRFRSQGFHHAAERFAVKCVELDGKMNYNCGVNMVNDVLALIGNTQDKVGVFASNDWMALGLMHALQENGIVIPDRISIIGCDDIPLASQGKPALTTFRWDFELLIEEVLTEFRYMYSSPTYCRKKIMLNAEYVERDTLRG
ncbi:MAG: LacI family DNA-binding transcriptional regulator [Treponemataceae bacterium]